MYGILSILHPWRSKFKSELINKNRPWPSWLSLMTLDLPLHSDLGRTSTTTRSPWTARFLASIPCIRMSLSSSTVLPDLNKDFLLSTLHTAVHIHGLDRQNMKDLSKKINKTPCLKFFTFLLDIESKAKTSAFLNNLLYWYILLLCLSSLFL